MSYPSRSTNEISGPLLQHCASLIVNNNPLQKASIRPARRTKIWKFILCFPTMKETLFVSPAGALLRLSCLTLAALITRIRDLLRQEQGQGKLSIGGCLISLDLCFLIPNYKTGPLSIMSSVVLGQSEPSKYLCLALFCIITIHSINSSCRQQSQNLQR
jgi:hypothetical protein